MMCRPALLSVMLVLAALSCSRAPSARLVVVTTTSVGNAGLLDVLTPKYEKEGGVTFGVHLAGSGRALQMLASGDADVVISHAPEAEAGALKAHADWWYRKIMFNDFLLVGAPDDPADARSAASLNEALRRIAASDAGFVSRADESGTHEREQALWTAAGVTPTHSLSTGQGMAMTLRITSDRGAYTLTDRATWLRFANSLRLTPVNEGDPRLVNTYAVIVGPGAQQRKAMAFAKWLTEGAGRDVIATVPGFTVWPRGRPGTQPGDRPER